MTRCTSLNVRARLDAQAAALADRYWRNGPLPHLQLFVSVEGEAVLDRCFGSARQDGPELAPDAIYRIASMSKPLVVAAFLSLVEEGLVSLDDPVASVLPECARPRLWKGEMDAEGNPITSPCDTPMRIIDLLRHTSGLSYSFHRQTPIDALYADNYLDGFHQRRTSAEYAKALAGVPLLFTPGERFHYSVSIDLLGLVMERVVGEPLDRLLARRVFDPLGMTDTGFMIGAGQRARLADAWIWDGVASPALYDRGDQSRWRIAQKCWSAGGGLLSTVRDYHRFLHMLLQGGELEGRRILSPQSVALMMQNHLPQGSDLVAEGSVELSETSLRGVGMGLGGAVIVDPSRALAPGSAGTFFWGGLLSTGFFADPARRIIGIVMTQLMPSGLTNLREDFRRAVYGALKEQETHA